MNIRRMGRILISAAFLATCAAQAEDRPNILVIWGDDVGQSNISAYSFGMMGYRTPNIDRLASEGMMFTDYYGEQSSTAGRAAYITGQSVYRTGLSSVGKPGTDRGMHRQDPTIAGLLKEYGYMTGQFGKNHLGDRDIHLPTNHGFDEFLGILYDLDFADQPDNADHLPESTVRAGSGQRGVIRSFADGRIRDTGPLTKERMQAIDEETIAATIDFIERAHADGKPFYVWWNGTRTQVNDGQPDFPGQGEHSDAMVEHDMHVGQLLSRLDELGIADNTIVHYSTDNGPHPDISPFFGDNSANLEGGRRVPSMIRWPGRIEAGSVSNTIMHHMDWLPTLLAAAGASDIKDRLKDGGVRAIGRRYKAHLDGYNFLPHLSGKAETGPRREIFYFAASGELTAIRYDDWKGIFMEQKEDETLRAQIEPWTLLRVPLIMNLRDDPYERASLTTSTHNDWMIDRSAFLAPAEVEVARFLATLEDFPSRQQHASTGIEQVLEMLQWSGTSVGSN